MKQFIIPFLLFTLVGCAFNQKITADSSQYPFVSSDDRAEIAQRLSSNENRQNYERNNNIVNMMMRAESKQPLSEGEVKGINIMLSSLQSDREKELQEKNRKDEEALSKEVQQEAEHKAQLQKEEAAQLARNYAREYDLIMSPEDAKKFINEYADKYDPNGLTRTALKKGYAKGIVDAQACVDMGNKMVERQHEIGKEVGYVDMQSIYDAGAQIVACRKRKQRYQAEAAKLGY